MGFFDFLNPKKKIAKSLAQRVAPALIPRAVELLKSGAADAAKQQLKDIADGQIREAAAEAIPEALQSHANAIIIDAVDMAVDEAYTKAKAQLGQG